MKFSDYVLFWVLAFLLVLCIVVGMLQNDSAYVVFSSFALLLIAVVFSFDREGGWE